jgi:hypothetical protein
MSGSAMQDRVAADFFVLPAPHRLYVISVAIRRGDFALGIEKYVFALANPHLGRSGGGLLGSAPQIAAGS